MFSLFCHATKTVPPTYYIPVYKELLFVCAVFDSEYHSYLVKKTDMFTQLYNVDMGKYDDLLMTTQFVSMLGESQRNE